MLEPVETSQVDLPSRTLTTMAELVGRGVRFGVDDFGTGYSSLARLTDLPAQVIRSTGGSWPAWPAQSWTWRGRWAAPALPELLSRPVDRDLSCCCG